MSLEKLTLVAGDDLPRLLVQLYDIADNEVIDLSSNDYVVLAKFREKNMDNVLMMVVCTKTSTPALGMVYVDFTATGLDQDAGTYEMEFFLSKSSSSGNITAATQASPVVITSALHGLSTGDEVLIRNVGGMIEINDKPYIVTKIDANTFSLATQDGVAVDGTAFTAYTAGGTWTKYSQIQTALDILPIKLKEDF